MERRACMRCGVDVLECAEETTGGYYYSLEVEDNYICENCGFEDMVKIDDPFDIFSGNTKLGLYLQDEFTWMHDVNNGDCPEYFRYNITADTKEEF